VFKRDLAPKQRIFIAEYLVHRNATKAAINAGYSAKTARSAGSRLLTNVDISRAIELGIREQLNKAEISSDQVIQTLRRIAFADNYDCNYLGKLKALEMFGNSLGLFLKKK
jgi:phage terminase small subunit